MIVHTTAAKTPITIPAFAMPLPSSLRDSFIPFLATTEKMTAAIPKTMPTHPVRDCKDSQNHAGYGETLVTLAAVRRSASQTRIETSPQNRHLAALAIIISPHIGQGRRSGSSADNAESPDEATGAVPRTSSIKPDSGGLRWKPRHQSLQRRTCPTGRPSPFRRPDTSPSCRPPCRGPRGSCRR